MKSYFATFGLQEILVNGQWDKFTSAAFEELLKANGMRHTSIAPYHPTSNGLAEHAVQPFKLGIKQVALKLKLQDYSPDNNWHFTL